MMVQEHHLIEEAEQAKLAPRITPQSVQETKEQISLLQGMVKDLLIRDVDFGRIPGTPADSLWEPGALQIIGSFNCYAGERRFLKFEDSAEKIAVCVEVPLIRRDNGRVAATGIGAASTLETKYKYRWVETPADWGFEGEEVKILKTKGDGRGGTLYRIPNPEHGELLNTLVKISSKRAEVDAAESLPGVSSVLRQMFSNKAFSPEGKPGGKHEDESPVWTTFWGETRKLGLTREQVHAKLGVPSMKDWLSSGKGIDQALDRLRRESTPPEPEVTPSQPITNRLDFLRRCGDLGIDDLMINTILGMTIAEWETAEKTYDEAMEIVEKYAREQAKSRMR